MWAMCTSCSSCSLQKVPGNHPWRPPLPTSVDEPSAEGSCDASPLPSAVSTQPHPPPRCVKVTPAAPHPFIFPSDLDFEAHEPQVGISARASFRPEGGGFRLDLQQEMEAAPPAEREALEGGRSLGK